MDNQHHHPRGRKESKRDVSCSRGHHVQRARNSRHTHRRFQYDNRVAESSSSSASAQSTSQSNSTGVVDIPGYIYDPIRKRYFKERQDQPKHSVVENETACQDVTTATRCKTQSRLQCLQKRETNSSYSSVHFKRKCLEEWARHVTERKSLTLSDSHPCPAFKGSLSSLALSRHCGKLVTIAKLPGLGCNTIHIYDVNFDVKEVIRPHMLATVIASEVTHVEWSPNENMKNFFLLNLLGSGDSKGSAIVCKFNESLQSCELNSYPLQNGTAWKSSWCGNPQNSNLLGIAGSKQAVLVDSEKKTLICKIRSSSDVFSIEFGRKSPVVYLGCRNGNIMCVDTRMGNVRHKPFNVSGRVRSSATCIKVLEDENYLMASSIDGMVKMFDVRLTKPVKEYCGNVNETKLIPFVMDSTENIMASAGHDGKTRLWSVPSCELLKTIDGGDASNGHVDIPPVCLGENWGLRNNMMAFGLGIEDQLKLYF